MTRRINAPTGTVAAALAEITADHERLGIDLGGRGRLVVDPSPDAFDGTWRGTGRLYPRGARLRRYERINIEISAWSTSANQLWLRPTRRSLTQAGARRLRRYFALAHLAGDQLCRTLTDAPYDGTRHPVPQRDTAQRDPSILQSGPIAARSFARADTGPIAADDDAIRVATSGHGADSSPPDGRLNDQTVGASA